MLHGCRLGFGQDFSKVDTRRRRDSWWRSPQLLDEEAEECGTVKLGKRAVRGHHVGHEIFGHPVPLSRLTVRASLTTRDAVVAALHQNMLA